MSRHDDANGQDPLALVLAALHNVSGKHHAQPLAELTTDAAQIAALALVSIACDVRAIRDQGDPETTPAAADRVACIVCRRPAGSGHKMDCPNR